VAEFASAMKIHPIILLFLWSVSIALSAKRKVVEQEKGVVSFKMFKCDVNPKFVFLNYSCFAKSYSRLLSTVTLVVYFEQPLYEIYVSFKLLQDEIQFNFQGEWVGQFKYGTVYREAIHGPKVEICGIMGVTEKENALVYHTMKLLNDTAPELAHPCPYTVRAS
jgi:hypothetical protein